MVTPFCAGKTFFFMSVSLGCQENARPMQHQFFFTGSSITENVGGEIVLCVVLEVLRRFCNSRYPFDDGRTIRDFRINRWTVIMISDSIFSLGLELSLGH